jgi:type II secretory pathway component PulC
MIRPWMIHRFFKVFNFFLAGICLIVLAAAARLLLTQDSKEIIQTESLKIPASAGNVQKAEKIDYSFPENLITEDAQVIENIDTGIELKGILSSPDHPYAIVLYKDEQKLVKIGDRIGAWQVSNVDEAGLTVHRQGKTVILKQLHQTFKSIAKPSVIEKEMPSAASNPEIPSENKITVDAQVFRGLMNNWADLFRGVQMMPYVEKGKSKGYVLCYLQPDGLMQKLGFRTGDIIEKINDREITNLQALMALYDFAEKGDCRVEIKRGPKKIQMVYQLSKNPV